MRLTHMIIPAVLALAGCRDATAPHRVQPEQDIPAFQIDAQERDALAVAIADARSRISESIGVAGGELTTALAETERAIRIADAHATLQATRSANRAMDTLLAAALGHPAEHSVVQLVIERLVTAIN
ncbi:MAG: hypothetical protein WD801_03555 [Gemmatimonadaceae bacterium]